MGSDTNKVPGRAHQTNIRTTWGDTPGNGSHETSVRGHQRPNVHGSRRLILVVTRNCDCDYGARQGSEKQVLHHDCESVHDTDRRGDYCHDQR